MNDLISQLTRVEAEDGKQTLAYEAYKKMAQAVNANEPGCLMYAVVLSYSLRPALRAIDAAHRFVLETICDALTPLQAGILRQGTSDLALDGRKFSGNSMRCKRRTLLYHGTLLYRFSLEQVPRYLNMPPRQPDYRRQRSHGDFVVNLPLDREMLATAVRVAFDADGPLTDWPRERTWRLAAERYRDRGWNERL